VAEDAALRWLPLDEALRRSHELSDAHLAIATHRLAHAAGAATA
jgi:hypothetical protein